MEWIVEKDRIYKLSETGRVELSLKRLDVLAEVRFEDGRFGVLLRTENKEAILDLLSIKRVNLANFLETPLERKAFSAYVEYVRHVLSSQEVPKVKVYCTLGWDKEEHVFKHPTLLGSDRFVSKNPYVNLVVEAERKEFPSLTGGIESFLAYLKSQVRKATDFSVLYAVGLASLFIEFVEECYTPFTVIVLGNSYWKNDACRLVQNAFLPSGLSLSARSLYEYEVILSSFPNMPVFFESLNVSEDNLERIILMTASGRGAARVVANSLRIWKLLSVVFLTPKTAIKFNRKGRTLTFRLSDKSVFGTQEPSYQLLSAWGHGIPFARALMEDKELVYVLWNKAQEWLRNKGLHSDDLTHVFMPCVASSFLIERILEEDLEAVRKKICTQNQK